MARILVVDDNPQIRALVWMVLKRAGHSPIEAGDGAAALAEIRRDKPDLVLLDVMMHGMDGWQVCREIKANQETMDVPVVMFTVRDSEEDMRKSFECGADAHITKLLNMKDLINTIEGLLGKVFKKSGVLVDPFDLSGIVER